MRFYIIGLITALICCAYFMGRQIGQAQVRATVVTDNLRAQNIIMKQAEAINAETFNTDTDTVRRWLREKYTIAE